MLDDLLTPSHLIFLLILALLIFGPRRLPEIGSALGKSIRDFRLAMTRFDSPPAGAETGTPDPKVPGDTPKSSG